MPMQLIGKGKLFTYSQAHADLRIPLDAWIAEVETAVWVTTQDIKNRYVTASFLGESRVVFNLKGNKYRLDVKIDLESQTVLVKRIGTHAEYDKWEF